MYSCINTFLYKVVKFLISLMLGTASAAMWTLRTEGRLFHSGLPHKGINSLELGMEAIAYVQNKFYQDFPPVSFSINSGLAFCLVGRKGEGGREREGKGVRETEKGWEGGRKREGE